VSKAAAAQITFDDFLKVDIRVGKIVEAAPFPEARKPAIKLVVDFGPEIGRKKSSAQITKHYQPDELVGRRVLGVVNFPPRQIGPIMSEVLVLGVPDEAGEVVLIHPGKDVPLGGRLF
jgi:tRNA-binding protein